MVSLDGGKVPLRTPKGLECQWRDYKAVRLGGIYYGAFFGDHQSLLDWINSQRLITPLICLGDGLSGCVEIVYWIAQLYNWTLEQLIALQGCLTLRQALVEIFEVFASNFKDELNGAECIHPSRFTPWIRRTSQAQLEPKQPQQLPNA